MISTTKKGVVSSKSTHNSIVSDDWDKKLSEDQRSNALIDVYVKGKQDGKVEIKKKIIAKLNKNIALAKKAAETIFKQLISKKIKCDIVYLKIEQIDAYKLLFVVDKGSYLSESFDSAYSLSRKQKTIAEKENIDIYIMFMPKTDTFNHDMIVSDGYYSSYAGQRKK